MKDLERTIEILKKTFVLVLEDCLQLLLGAFANEGHLYLYYHLRTKVQLIFLYKSLRYLYVGPFLENSTLS